MDLQFLIFLFPAGVALCFRQLRDEHIFVIIYALVASYFAGVMVRLMLTLTPVVCVSSAVALSTLLDTYIEPSEPETPNEPKSEPWSARNVTTTNAPPASAKKARKVAVPAEPSTPKLIENLASTMNPVPATKKSSKKSRGIFGLDPRLVIIFNTIGMLIFFVTHCTWVTSVAYSSPSVVLSSTNADGSQHIIDDFREAYYWLRQNTPEEAVVMSWWDYGYQIAGMADRATLVDNNTWNNSMNCYFLFELNLSLKRYISSYCHGGQGHV